MQTAYLRAAGSAQIKKPAPVFAFGIQHRDPSAFSLLQVTHPQPFQQTPSPFPHLSGSFISEGFFSFPLFLKYSPRSKLCALLSRQKGTILEIQTLDYSTVADSIFTFDDLPVSVSKILF